MASHHVAPFSVSDILWGAAYKPETYIFCAVGFTAVYIWYQMRIIDKKAEAILKDVKMPPKDLIFLHRAIRREPSEIVIRVLEKVESAICDLPKGDSSPASNIFQLEMGEKVVTSLMIACEERKWEVMGKLVVIAAKKPFFNFSDNKGQTNFIKWISQQDRLGATALHKVMYQVLHRHNAWDENEKYQIRKSAALLKLTDPTVKDAMGHPVSEYAQKLAPVLPEIRHQFPSPLSRSDGWPRR